ncbi:hypothetical protein GCK72_019177 [Caenorhabditis remanei]|uniref:Uncharacterized protein n=1 Tax=Caenorhabditis remanei TaxID=31234 RepID=A0A6A5GDS0_CAERE|nr:hypothetical protein GCK72_019177 [Caenorhabditis remanei]KAF1752622.1 hypothetical protein GCK72_019177 [Caenorhabditis remanei]
MSSETNLLYPPPKKSTYPIVSIVVEKKGDETKTSMRQSEIYAYSPWIRIGGGCMIMPTINYDEFQPGDWFKSKPVYATDRSGEVADERELTCLQKINPSDHNICKIPPTRVVNGNVQIVCAFMLCPKFIQNLTTKNSFGCYKKLYLLNMGQGFVHSNHPFFRQLDSKIYFGVFEFRAKDNGAVNFSSRSILRNQSNSLLERDCMWELVDILEDVVGEEVKEEMENKIDKLREAAKSYHEELKNRPIDESAVKKEALNERGFESEKHPSPCSPPNKNASPSEPTTSNEIEYLDLESYRSRIIVSGKYRGADGVVVEKWKDLETGEMSTSDDILVFKFNARYGVIEHSTPTTTTPTTSHSSNKAVILNSESEENQREEPKPVEEDPDVTMYTLELRGDNNANPIPKSQSDHRH